jgi:cell wall-associated NlpC family hydrolase
MPFAARLPAALAAAMLLLALAAVPATAQEGSRGDDPAAYDDPYADPYGDEGSHDDQGDDNSAPDATDGGDAGVEQPEIDPVVPEPFVPEPFVPKNRTVGGKVAFRRADGTAAIPRAAPKRIKAIISWANRIIGKPYKWGGGHARLIDSGYDCSGTVSYALIRAGLLGSPLVSGGFARWAAKGAGRYVTIYANNGHVYMEVAGLRLDTSQVGDWGGRSGVRWRPVIGKRRGFKVRHIPGL